MKPGLDNNAQNFTKENLQLLKRLFDENDQVLLHSHAAKFTFSSGYLHGTFIKKCNIKRSYHGETKGSYQEKQKNIWFP